MIEQVTTDAAFRDLLRELASRGWDTIIPTVILAEVVTGRRRDATTNQTVRRVGTLTTDEPTARQAGRLRAETAKSKPRHLPSGIDAIVAAHALSAESGIVFTTDPDDLGRLLADHPRVSVERP